MSKWGQGKGRVLQVRRGAERSLGHLHAAAQLVASRGRSNTDSRGPRARRRKRRRARLRSPRRAGPVGAGHAERAAGSDAGGCGGGAAGREPARVSWVSEEPRIAEPAARRGAMEIGTEISRKIRVRPALSVDGNPGLSGQASARLSGVTGTVGPAWTPRPSRRRWLWAGRRVGERLHLGLGRLGPGRRGGPGESGGRAGPRQEKAARSGRRRVGPGGRPGDGGGGGGGEESRGRGRGPGRLPTPTWARGGGRCTQPLSCLCVKEPGDFPPFSHARLFFFPPLRVPLRGNCKN